MQDEIVIERCLPACELKNDVKILICKVAVLFDVVCVTESLC